MSDFAKFSKIYSVFLYFSCSYDGRTEGGDKNNKYLSKLSFFVCLMVFNTLFNNISVISWPSVLLVEETGRPRENHRPVASH